MSELRDCRHEVLRLQRQSSAQLASYLSLLALTEGSNIQDGRHMLKTQKDHSNELLYSRLIYLCV